MLKPLALACAGLLIGSGAASAAELQSGKIYLIERFEGLKIQFEVESWPSDALGVTLSIDPPASLKSEKREVNSLLMEFGKDVPNLDLREITEELPDGRYGYEISVGTSEKVKRDEEVNNGRGKDRGYDLVAYTVSGSFVIDGEKIVQFPQGEEKGSEKPVDGPDVDDSDGGKG